MLCAVAEAQVAEGDTRGAVRTVSEALAATRGIEDADDRGTMLRDIVTVQASAGDVEGALAGARRVKDANNRAYALLQIAEAQMDLAQQL